MKLGLRVLILLLLCGSIAHAQRRGYVIFSGKIIDVENKAPIVGASVFFSGSSAGGTTDSLGQFTVTIAARSYQVIARSLGYKFKTFKLDLSKNTQTTIELERSEQLLGEVVITAGEIRQLLGEPFDADVARAELARQIQDIQRDGLVRAQPHHFGDREFDEVADVLINQRSIAALLGSHEKHKKRRQRLSNTAVRLFARDQAAYSGS